MRISYRTWAMLCLLSIAVMALPGSNLTGGAIATPGGFAQLKHPGLGTAPPDLTPLAGGLPEFPSNITHFVYIVRENHVFDDYLGDCALDINSTCDDGQGWTSPACSSPPCLGLSTTETAASGDQLDTPYLHELARQYAVFDNYYSSVDPYSAQAHAYFFTGTVDGGTDTGGTCPTTVQGTGAGSEWADYNTTDVQEGDCGYSTDSGSQDYPSSGSIFDRFTSSTETPTAGSTTPPFLTVGDILWELNSPGCTHDSFGAIAGGLPGNSEAIDYVTCTSGNGWWTNTTNGEITTPPVINPVTHTPQMLDVCQYACDDIPTYPDEWAANDFISYVKDYGLPTYTFIELFDDHPSSGSTTNCGAATQADCIQYNDESMDRIVTDLMNGSSPYRNNTMVVIQEDDTQDGENGADHVNNGRRIPMVVVAPPNVEKTGNPNPASCGIATTGLAYDQCGNVVHETYNTSNVLAAMERVEMNVYPSIYSASITATTFPMVQNDELAMVNPLEALWKCNDPATQPYCNTGVSSGNFLTSTTVSPNPVSTTPSGTVSVSATSGDNGTTFTGPTYAWSLYPTTLGTLSATTGSPITFTAGTSTGLGHLCENATYKVYEIVMDCAIVDVATTIALASVAVTPPSLNVPAGGTSSAISATATTTTGSQIYQGTSGSTWAWSLSNSLDGSLNATSGQPVTFTAGANWGNVTACLNVTWGSPSVTKSACTWISVSKAPPQLNHVTVTPVGPITLATGATQLVQVTPYNQYGQIMYGPPLGFNFTLSHPGLGTVNPVSQPGWSAYTNFTAGTLATTGTLTVTVSDGVNIPHSATLNITVTTGPVPLTATFTQSPWHGAAPLTVDLSGSIDGGSGTGYTQSWSWGDGSAPTPVSGASISLSHTYSAAGEYLPTLTVVDSQGNTATFSLGEVSVFDNSTAAPLAATCSGTPLTGTATPSDPLVVSLSGDATGGVAPYTYDWVLGDGTTATGPNPTHSYPVGTYHIVLFVNDSDSHSAECNLEAVASAPSAQGLSLNLAVSGAPGPAPLLVAATASASGGTPPYSYAWTFGDGSTGSGASVSHTYDAVGTYTLSVQVSDAAHDTPVTENVTIVVTGPSSPSSSGPWGISLTEWYLIAAVIALAILVIVLLAVLRRPKSPPDDDLPYATAPGPPGPYRAVPTAGPPQGPSSGPPSQRPSYPNDDRAPDPWGSRG